MKRRVSVTVDEHLLDAAEAAVRAGRAPSMSALVEDALRREVEERERRAAFGDFTAHIEAEHGPITDRDRAEARAQIRRRSRTPQKIMAETRRSAA